MFVLDHPAFQLFVLYIGHICPIIHSVKGVEFIRMINKFARKQGIACVVDNKRGKESHVTLYFGDKRTIVRNPKEELKKGTVSAMLRQLGLTQHDIQDN